MWRMRSAACMYALERTRKGEGVGYSSILFWAAFLLDIDYSCVSSKNLHMLFEAKSMVAG